MQYLKHSDLAAKYHVSLKTVHNWIDAAKHGKIPLRLHETENRTYIIDTPENILILKQLSEKGKKYRNTLHHKVIHPKSEFYKIYDRRQILDIITNLNVHKEIPSQYEYLEDGATYWDDWLKSLASEKTPNILRGSMELIRANMGVIEQLLAGNNKINVIDLGVGNAFPVKELLGHLIERDILHRYIALDISPTMLSIAKRNIEEWYGDKAKFEGYVRNISHEHFDDLLVEDMLNNEADQTLNLVLLFGGTSANFRSFGDVFKAIHGSMSGKDLLMYTDGPDTEASRQYFDFSPLSGLEKLAQSDQYVLNLLNVDESLYEAEMGFDPRLKMRYVRVRLKTSITIKFSFEDAEREVILEKGETILLLRIWHMTALEIISEFEKTGFRLLQSSLTKDRQYFLSISGVEAK